MDSPRGHSPREEDQIHDFAPRLDSKNDVSSHTGELKDGAIVRPWLAYGITSRVRNNAFTYHDGGKTLCYPVGAHCSFFNSSTGETTFFPGQDKVQTILGLAMSHNKKYMACIEELEEDQVQRVTVYSLLPMRPVRTLMDPESRTNITGVSFNESTKFLLIQHGEPDNTLVVWKWQNGRVFSSISFETPVHKAIFSPSSSIAFATICSGSASIHRVDADHSVVRSVQVATASDPSKEAFTSLAWLAGHLIAFTTSAGHIQVNHEGEMMGMLTGAEGDCLMSVVPRGRGLVAGGQSGTLYFFDATLESLDVRKKKKAMAAQPLGSTQPQAPPAEDAPLFKLTHKATINTFGASIISRVPTPSFLLVSTARSFDSNASKRSSKLGESISQYQLMTMSGYLKRGAVLDMIVGGGEDSVAVFTAGGEVLTVEVSELVEREERKVDEHLADSEEPMNLQGPFKLLHGGFGNSRVVGLDAITFRPLLAIATADRFVRVTNYDSRRGVASTLLSEDAHSCSLHPSGTQLLVGCQDKLRLFGVALDELPLIHEFPVKCCNIVRYSTGGAFFAAVGRSNTIQIYHTYSLQLMGHLKGHVSAVTSISFSPDDRKIVSTGAGGAVYFWDLTTFTRISEEEYVDKTVVYCSGAVLTRGQGAVVRAHDGRLQHLEGGDVGYEVQCEKGGERSPITLLGSDGNVLLAGTTRGSVLSFPWPISMPIPHHAPPFPPPREYRLHARTPGQTCGLSSLIALETKGLLFTAASDGTVIVSKLTLVRRGAVIEYIDVSLNNDGSIPIQYVSVAEWRLRGLKDKQDELLALVASTKTASEYQTLRATIALRDQLKTTEDELSKTKVELNARKDEVEDLLSNASDRERKLVSSLESSHNAAADELERLYDRRIELEAERLKQALGAKDDLQFRMEEEMERLKMRHGAKVQSLEAKILSQAQKYEVMLQEAKDALVASQKNAEEYALQTEIDYDENRERMEQKLADSSLVSEERESRLKAENHLLKRANMRIKGEKAIELKRMEKMSKDNESLRLGMIDLQDTIDKLTEEMREREVVMTDNFSTIQTLRRRVQDLEQYKFVLGYKAESYQAQLKPKIEEAERLNKSLQDHDKELISSAQSVRDLTNRIKDNARQVASLKTEIQDLKIANKHQKDKLNIFSSDVHAVMNASAERPPQGGKSDRQKALEALYKNYCLGGGAKTESQVEQELVKHLGFTEKRASILQAQLEHKDALIASGGQKAQLDNSHLLNELQASHQSRRSLQRQLDSALSEIKDLKTANKLMQRKMQGSQVTVSDVESSPEAREVKGGVSRAGPIAPSRPTSAIPVPSNSSSRPTSATTFRSPFAPAARHKEQTPVSEDTSYQDISSQSTLKSLMASAEMASASSSSHLRKALFTRSPMGDKTIKEEEEEEGEDMISDIEKLLANHRLNKTSPAPKNRPTSAVGGGFKSFYSPSTGTGEGSAVRRRPSSAAGMGYRAVSNVPMKKT